MTTQDSLTMVSPFFRASMQVTGLSARRVLRIFKALVAFILKSSLSYEIPSLFIASFIALVCSAALS